MGRRVGPPAAQFPPSGTAPPAPQQGSAPTIPKRVPERGRQRSLDCKVGKGIGGRRGGEECGCPRC